MRWRVFAAGMEQRTSPGRVQPADRVRPRAATGRACGTDQELDLLRSEVARLQAERNELQQQFQQAVIIGPEELERFAVTGQAMGVSLRQARNCWGRCCRPNACPITPPWAAGPRPPVECAGEVLAVLDPLVRGRCGALRRRDLFWGVATLVAVEPTSLALLECAQDRRSFGSGVASSAGAVRESGVRGFGCSQRDRGRRAGGGVGSCGVRVGGGAGARLGRVSHEPGSPAGAGGAVATSRGGLGRSGNRRRQGGRDRAQAARMPARAARQARRAWEEAERLLADVARQESAWQRARAAWPVFRPDGTLNERAWAEAEIDAALAELRGLDVEEAPQLPEGPASLDVPGSAATSAGRGGAGPGPAACLGPPLVVAA